MQNGQAQKALNTVDELIDLEPANIAHMLLKIETLIVLQRYDEALNVNNKVLEVLSVHNNELLDGQKIMDLQVKHPTVFNLLSSDEISDVFVIICNQQKNIVNEIYNQLKKFQATVMLIIA